MNYAEKTRLHEPYLAFMTRRLCMKEYQSAIIYKHLLFRGLKMEQGKKRRVCDVLKWPTKKQATQVEIDPQAIVEAPAVLFPKHG